MEKRFDEKYIKFHSDNPGCVLLTLKNDGSLIDDDEIRFSLKRFISQEIQLAVEGERIRIREEARGHAMYNFGDGVIFINSELRN